MKPVTIILLLMTITTASRGWSQTMPSVSGHDLNGRPWTAPAGLPGTTTLLLVGFEEPQQAEIDTWIEGMDLKAPANTTAWIEMPVIENPGVFMRWFIDTGMRGGIRDEATRARVWTAYTDRAAFLKACGIASTDTICVLVVRRDGKVLAAETGPFTASGARKLRAALEAD